MLKPAELQLTQNWDKTFPKSNRVDHKKVTFINRYGITLAADQYAPRTPRADCPPWPSAAPSER